jgi:hypothetical protein
VGECFLPFIAFSLTLSNTNEKLASEDVGWILHLYPKNVGLLNVLKSIVLSFKISFPQVVAHLDSAGFLLFQEIQNHFGRPRNHVPSLQISFHIESVGSFPPERPSSVHFVRADQLSTRGGPAEP